MDRELTIEEVEDVLLAWINTFPLEEEATTLQELTDGRIIWEALGEIDPKSFTGTLPNSLENNVDWKSQQQNLEHISQSLFSYITVHSGRCNPPKSDLADLKRIAQDSDVQETIKFMKLVFLGVAVCPLGPRKDECQRRMAAMEETTMLGLGSIMADVPGWAMPSDSSDTDSPRTQDEGQNEVSAPTVDSDLLHEAKVAELRATNSQLKHEVQSLRKLRQEEQGKYTRLQDNHELLKDELGKVQDRLQITMSASKGDADPNIKLLQLKIQEKDEIISDKDHETFEMREQMQKNVRDLKAERAKVQEFKDELDVIRSERDNFAKKANTLEKYKQKIQSSQQDTDQLRKEIAQLRKENDAATDALKHHSHVIDDLRQANTKLELEHNEYRPALSRSEQHNHDLQKAKKRLEFDNAELAQRLHASEQKEQALLRELGQDRRESMADQSPEVATDRNLLTELGGDSEGENQLRRDKISLLEAEHRETQSDRDAQNSALQTMLDNANERQRLRDEKHLERYHEKLQLEPSLKKMQEGTSIEESKSTRPQVRENAHNPDSTEIFQKRTAQLENEKKKRAEIETELREAIRQVDASQRDLALVDMDKLKMLEEVKKQNSTALIELQKQHKLLQGNYKEAENDLDSHRALLRRSMDNRTSMQTTASQQQELQKILEVVRAATSKQSTQSTSSTNSHDAIAKRIESLTNVITRDREGVAVAREQIEERDNSIRDLQARLQQLQEQHQQQANAEPSPPAPPLPDEANQASYIANLERENRLMASAYHTLASRLQMSNVVLLRKNDMDTSWLNKQRRLVEQTIPGKSG